VAISSHRRATLVVVATCFVVVVVVVGAAAAAANGNVHVNVDSRCRTRIERAAFADVDVSTTLRAVFVDARYYVEPVPYWRLHRETFAEYGQLESAGAYAVVVVECTRRRSAAVAFSDMQLAIGCAQAHVAATLDNASAETTSDVALALVRALVAWRDERTCALPSESVRAAMAYGFVASAFTLVGVVRALLARRRRPPPRRAKSS
jgi:hypothetical protein